jgi:acetyl esterase
LALLDQRVERKQHKGIELLIKKIPDSDVEEDFDPRVLQAQLEQARVQVLAPKPESEILDIEYFPIREVRANTSWPNTDVSTREIATTFRIIQGGQVDIPVRIYSPKGTRALPAVVFFHGGGFITGSVQLVEDPCKALADKAGAVVISVDYRLAPEHPFPAGLTDCFDAVKWAFHHAGEIGVNPVQIAVAGDSAGGNLATVCALIDRDMKAGMIHYPGLVYPLVNFGNQPVGDHEWRFDEYTSTPHLGNTISSAGH